MMLVVVLGFVFNTVVPSQVIHNWIPTLLTVGLDPHLSYTITLKTGTPQGCVLSPILYSLSPLAAYLHS